MPTWRLLAARGLRSWLADMVNVSELLINLVSTEEPKLLEHWALTKRYVAG